MSLPASGPGPLLRSPMGSHGVPDRGRARSPGRPLLHLVAFALDREEFGVPVSGRCAR